jgi:hypothetical protein
LEDGNGDYDDDGRLEKDVERLDSRERIKFRR